ncbi:N-methyl-L-tryptophan oxidase [Virgibacillus oceani]
MKVAVIGLGTMGSMAVWQLAKRDISVTGFEQFGIGHDRSAVGGESRLFRTAYREGAEYVPLLRSASNLWRDLEKESGNKLLSMTGGLTIGKKNTENVNNVLTCINDFDIDHAQYTVEEARKLFPQHKIEDDDAVILDKESGFLRPELAVVSAVNEAAKLGAEIRRNQKVEAVEDTGEKVIITANSQKYEFDQVIVANGSWVSELLPAYNQVVKPRRIIMSWFIPEDLSKYQVDNFPIFARTTKEYDYFGTPTLDNSMVKIALIGSEEEIDDPDRLEHNVSTSEIKRQSHLVEKYFHDINPDPVRLSVHMDAYTPDEHAIVGKLEDSQNIVVMSGYSGHGFKLAPVMGEIASDLIVHGKTAHYIEHFNPSRFNRK